jgi:hypothetical protein
VSAGQVEIAVDELVVDGLDPGARAALAEVVQRRLGELVAERGLPAGSAGAPWRQEAFADLRAPVTSRVEVLGVELAEALYRGLGR